MNNHGTLQSEGSKSRAASEVCMSLQHISHHALESSSICHNTSCTFIIMQSNQSSHQHQHDLLLTADLQARYQTTQNVFSICLKFSDTPAKRASSVPLNAERAKNQVIIFTWRPRCTVTLVQNVACAESSSHGDPFSSSMSITATSNVGGKEKRRV